MKSPGCLHNRVVRLEISGHDDHWICNLCNDLFVPKSACDYKIAHLVASVYQLNEQLEELRNVKDKGVRREEGIS